MKSFETSAGPKQDIRDALTKAAQTHLPNVRKIFTLPGRECLCVKTFQHAFPQANIKAVEKNKDDWQRIVDYGVDCTMGTVQDYCAQVMTPTMHHDLVFLDYFSFLNKDVLDGINAFVRNPFIFHQGKQTILGITLMKAIRQEKDSMLEFIKANTYLRKGEEPENTLATVGAALQMEVTRENTDYIQGVTLLDSREYKAASASAPMYFYMFLLEK